MRKALRAVSRLTTGVGAAIAKTGRRRVTSESFMMMMRRRRRSLKVCMEVGRSKEEQG